MPTRRGVSFPRLLSYVFEEHNRPERRESGFAPLAGAPAIELSDLQTLRRLSRRRRRPRPFASAPVRSKPRRTYDPSRLTPDPEGDYVPMYLADVYSRNKQAWGDLKEKLEGFGKASGLFDQISIKRLGNRDSGPFQVQVRKFGGGLKGPQRNLIDVGYGVSQVLPVITELLREDAPDMFPVAATGSTPSPQCTGRTRQSVLRSRRAGSSTVGRDPQRPPDGSSSHERSRRGLEAEARGRFDPLLRTRRAGRPHPLSQDRRGREYRGRTRRLPQVLHGRDGSIPGPL